MVLIEPFFNTFHHAAACAVAVGIELQIDSLNVSHPKTLVIYIAYDLCRGPPPFL